MYVNGMGFRGIERVKGVHHTTVITWVKQGGELLPDAYTPEMIPQRTCPHVVGELDELETFVGSKKTKSPKGRREASALAYRFAYGSGQPSITSNEVF